MLLTFPRNILSGYAFKRISARVAEPDVSQIVLIYVADDPQRGQVGNREWVRSVVGLHQGSDSHLLIGDDSGSGRKDVHHEALLGRIVAEQAKMFFRRLDIDLGLVFGVLRDLQIVQGDGAVVVEILGAVKLSSGQNLVRDSHFVRRISAGDIVASNRHQ